MKSNRRLLFITCALLVTLLPNCTQEAKAERKLSAAQKHFENGDLAAAEIELKNVLSLQPGQPDALKTLGLIWVRQGMMLDGARILTSAKQYLPEDDTVGVQLAYALLEMGFIDDSRKLLLEVLDRSPADGEALVLLAESTLTPETLAETEKRIEKSTATDKPLILLATALLQLRRGELDSGIATVERVLELDPKNARAHALRGTIHKLGDAPEEAVQSMKTAADLAGPASREIGLYAKLLMELERRDEAVAALKQATEAAPDFLSNWEILGKIAASESEEEKAEEYLSKVLARSPLDIEAALLMSQVWVLGDEAAKAVELLESVTREFPSRPVIDLALAKAYLAKGDFPKSTEALDRVLAMVPGASEAILLRTRLHLQNNEPEEAIRFIDPLVTAEPSNRLAQDLLVQAYDAASKPNDAISLLRKQIETSPEDPAPLMRLGLLLRSQNRPDEARREFEKVLELAPGNLGAVSQLAAMDQQEGNPDEAMRRADAYLESHPNSAEAHLLKAGIFFALKDWSAAEASLEKVIDLKPDALPAYGMLVRILVDSGRPEEAVNRLNRLLEASPDDNIDICMQLGDLLINQERFEDAQGVFEKLAELHPDHAPAYNNLAYLYSKHLEDLEKAHSNAIKARDLDPRNPFIADTLGWIESLRGNHSEALPLLQEAVAGLPNLPSVHYHLATAQYLVGNSKAATAGFEKSLSIETPFPEKADAENRLAALRSGEEDPAVLEQKARENPDDVVTQMQFSEALTRAGPFKEAVAAYNRALALNPNLEAAHLGLFELYANKLGEPAKALEAASEARRVAPSSATALAALGRAHFINRNYDQAYGFLADATSGLTAETDLLADFAWTAYSLGRVEEARKTMERALTQELGDRENDAKTFLTLTAPGRLEDPAAKALAEATLARNPDHVPALMVTATHADRERNTAVERYQKILSIYPGFDPARKALARHYLDDPAKLGEAEKLANEARRRLTDDPELTSLLAIISYRKGDHGPAAQLLRELATQRTLTARELFALGMSQATTGQQDDARQTLERSLEAGLSEAEATEVRATLEGLDEQAD